MTTREELIEVVDRIFLGYSVMEMRPGGGVLTAWQVADALLAAFPHIAEEPEWEWGIRATGDEEPYTDISTDRDWLLGEASSTDPMIEHTQLVRRRAPGPWETVDQDPQDSSKEVPNE